METGKIIWYSLAVLAPLLVFFSQEAIKQLIHKFFSQLNNAQINRAFWIAVLAVFIVPACIGKFSEGDTNKGEKSDLKVEQAEARISAADENKNKSDVETYVEAGKYLIEKGEEIADKKRRKDSVFKANRPQVWVYQIGSYKRKEAAWDLYKKLKDIPGICFYRDRKEYLVIIHNGYESEEQLRTSQTNITELLQDVGEQIQVLDLMTLCSKKEDIIETEKVRNKKEDIESRCFICDK